MYVSGLKETLSLLSGINKLLLKGAKTEIEKQ